MREPPADAPLLSIDTGGTFTDAILTRADRSVSHAKVLSSSAMRAEVAAVDSPAELRLRIDAPAPLIVGWRFDASPLRPRVVEAFDDLGLVRIRLDAPLPAPPTPRALADLLSPWPAPILAARRLLAVAASAPLPALRMRLATTRGTNALLEGRLDRVLLVTNGGLGDALRIGDQRRPALFALRSEAPCPIDHRVIEVALRHDALGRELAPLDEPALRSAARRFIEHDGAIHAAVVLMHAWRVPEAERRIARLLRECGCRRVVASHECSGVEGWIPRGRSTLVDASLSTAVGSFLDEVRRELGPDSTLDVMTSTGALRRAERFEPRESLLSGPAGGAVSIAAMSVRRQRPLLGFDMGGTSTDACRVDGAAPLREETAIAGLRLALPSIAIESVAAGGGSICRIEDGALRVGPASAGADPGPACYGGGGPLTITDVDLLLGRAVATLFAVPIDEAAARRALAPIAEARPDADEVRTLEDLLAIADASMADAVRAISVREGFDPGRHSLLAFGGAGGQHACAVADRLGIPEVIHPAASGLYSAAGISLARREWSRTEGASRPLDATSIREAVARALEWIRGQAAEDGCADPRVARVEAEVRLAGRSGAVEVELPIDAASRSGHELLRIAHLAAVDRYRATFGAEPPENRPELGWVRLGAAEPDAPALEPPPTAATSVDRSTCGTGLERTARRGPCSAAPTMQRMRSAGRWCDARVIDRATLSSGDAIDAPSIVADRHSTLVIDMGWRGEVDPDGSIRLRRRDRRAATGPAADRIESSMAATPPEVHAAAIAATAIEMGEQLRRTAVSVNVRDRLDYSCGILDGSHRLVTNAPHMPVHLGALGPCVASLSRVHRWRAGEVIVTNHPDHGGSHLPDLTVVMPLRSGDSAGEAPFAFLAARAHHAEIGGVRPGSMSPRATRLEEEGVVIPPTPIVQDEIMDLAALERILRGAPWPSRRVDDNLADVAAAVAALRRGAEGLRRIVAEHGRPVLLGAMESLRSRSMRAARRAIEALPDRSSRSIRQTLDDGWPIEIRIERRGERLAIDFTGSGGVHPGPFNAPFAVVRSAVMYSLRLLIESRDPTDDRALPLNDGLLDPVDLVVPPGFLNPPIGCGAPVAAGNTETSQRVVDAMLLVLDLSACGPGTMNNLVMGSRDWSFYETIAGGHGAVAQGPGASGMHAHMTNTRITDPEILESRFPLRLRRFELRGGSGGAGAHRGGDGLVREIEFLEPSAVALVSQRRRQGPEGLRGGGDGSPGRQRLIRADGAIVELDGITEFDASAGERIVIETPGGGGFGGRGG